MPASNFPMPLLLVSGGHCQILRVEGVGQYRRLATTIDDALGEAFDKTAKILGLGYPGGPAVEQLAREGDPAGGAAAAPADGQQGTAFLLRRAQERGAARARKRRAYADADIAASFQQAAIDCLLDRTAPRAWRAWTRVTALVVAGGVAANRTVRARARRARQRHSACASSRRRWRCAPTMPR